MATSSTVPVKWQCCSSFLRGRKMNGFLSRFPRLKANRSSSPVHSFKCHAEETHITCHENVPCSAFQLHAIYTAKADQSMVLTALSLATEEAPGHRFRLTNINFIIFIIYLFNTCLILKQPSMMSTLNIDWPSGKKYIYIVQENRRVWYADYRWI